MTESELCQKAIDQLRAEGWKIYPEWNTWDFMAARDHEGTTWTVGFQAKLRWSIGLLRQCVVSRQRAHWTVALVERQPQGAARDDYNVTAQALGIQQMADWQLNRTLQDPLLWLPNLHRTWGKPPWFCERPRLKFPPFEAKMEAGVPCPSGYPTPWKLAVRDLLEHMQRNGEITTPEASAVVRARSPRSDARAILEIIARHIGKRSRAFVWVLRPDALERAVKAAPAAWLEAI